MCSYVGWVSHGGPYLRNGGVNREGLRKLGSCRGIGGVLLKFERKCRWTEQREKIHMVTGVAWGFDDLS